MFDTVALQVFSHVSNNGFLQSVCNSSVSIGNSYNTNDCTGTASPYNKDTGICFSSSSGYYVKINCTDSTSPQKPASVGSFVSLCAAAFAGSAAISLSML